MFVLSLGGYTTGPKQLIQMLRQKSRPYLFSNTLPPAVVGGAIKVRCMVAYGEALRGALAAGREKKRELATTSLEFEFHLQFPCSSPSTELSLEISANQWEVETSANVNKHWKTRAKGNDVITNVISTNQHLAWTFSMKIFKFQRRSCKLSFLFPPRRALEGLLAG